MAKNDRTVEGFCFTSKEEADLARIELEKIKMMDDKLNYHDSEMVKSVYDRAILNRTFRTPVGHQFLYHLRRELLESGYTDADLKPIPLTVRFAPTARSIAAHKTENTGQAPKKKQSSIGFSWSVALNIVLIILVCAMFVITMNSDNPNILNYRTQIVDQYASWEEELNEKEDALRDWERELNERGAQQ